MIRFATMIVRSSVLSVRPRDAHPSARAAFMLAITAMQPRDGCGKYGDKRRERLRPAAPA